MLRVLDVFATLSVQCLRACALLRRVRVCAPARVRPRPRVCVCMLCRVHNLGMPLPLTDSTYFSNHVRTARCRPRPSWRRGRRARRARQDPVRREDARAGRPRQGAGPRRRGARGLRTNGRRRCQWRRPRGSGACGTRRCCACAVRASSSRQPSQADADQSREDRRALQRRRGRHRHRDWRQTRRDRRRGRASARAAPYQVSGWRQRQREGRRGGRDPPTDVGLRPARRRDLHPSRGARRALRPRRQPSVRAQAAQRRPAALQRGASCAPLRRKCLALFAPITRIAAAATSTDLSGLLACPRVPAAGRAVLAVPRPFRASTLRVT